MKINQNLLLKWSIFSNSFEMQIEHNSENWVGFGLCPSMENCDMFSLQLNGLGQVSVVDLYSKDAGNPPPDAK